MLKNLSILQRLKIWQKLALIAVFMGLPIPVITTLYGFEKNAAIGFSQKEIYGAEYLPPLKTLAKELTYHRSLASAYLNGEPAVQSQLIDSERTVDQQLSLAEELDQKEIRAGSSNYGMALQTSGRLGALRQKWDVLKAKTLTAQPQENFETHSNLIFEVNDLITHAGDQSNLILDPDLDSYYLMDAVITQIPRLTEELGRLRGLGAGMAARKKATPEDLAQISALFGQVQSNLRVLERGFGVVYRTNPALKERHAGQVEVVIKEATDYLAWVGRRLNSTAELTVTPTQFLSAGASAIERMMRLDELALNDLQGLLKIRINQMVRERNLVLILTALGLLLTILAVTTIARGINRQTNEITALIAAVDSGNLGQRARVISEDELGRAAQTFNKMLDNTRGLIQSRAERDQIQRSIMKLLEEVSNVADGDLTCEAEVTEGMTGAIADAFNYMIDNLRQLIGKVQTVSHQVNSTASQTQTTAERLAQGSQEQAAQITNTSTALSEMTRTIQQVSENAETSAKVATQALGVARQGAEVVQDTMFGMHRILDQVQETARRIQQLSERSQEIEEIIHLIDEIADRTGILALNASIQAATAGGAGQGFVVVANEVELLAGRSAEATKRISTLIRTIQGGTSEALAAMAETSREVQSGARLATQAGQSLQEIEAVSQQLADLVRVIADDCKQQARSSAHLSQTMTKLASLTNQTTTGVIQSAVTVKSLAELADELRASVISFKLPTGNGSDDRKGSHGKLAYHGTAHLN
jgi:methyl-accepting chemotaxis protein